MSPLLADIKPLCADNMLHALAHLPEALELVRIDCTRAKTPDVAHARARFGREVKTEFLKDLAENHAADLRAMKVSDASIETMAISGDTPQNSRGQQLDASVDHILSLHLCGTNDFENLALIPVRFNALKDKLENIQLDKTTVAASIVTIQPKRSQTGAFPKIPLIEGGFTVAKWKS